jgi:DNA-binding GntR family transcriptional regulator
VLERKADQMMPPGELPDGGELKLGRKASSSRRADQVYQRLRKAILSGEILSRTRLVETEVAAMLGASRTPVREAISRLIRDRLVTPLASGGVEVVDTQREYDEICCIREALEGAAARLAATHINEAELQRLEELLQESSKSALGDYQGRIVLNQEFHQIIFNASRSTRLIEMINDFREFFLNERVLEMYTRRDTETALKHHFEIVDALRARDGTRVEKLVRRHLEHFRRRAKRGAFD